MEITIMSPSCAATIDTHGAEWKSFQDVVGDEYLWQADPAFWGKTSPVLFPNVGVLPGGQAMIGGKPYPLRRHGFARDLEFRVMYQEQDRVTLCLNANEETLREFPFPFMFRITYIIRDCEMEIRYDVMNTGDAPMYYKLGAHPAFRCPLTEGDRFENYEIRFSEVETAACPVMLTDTQQFDAQNRVPVLQEAKSFRLDYGLFDRTGDALVFDGLKSRRVTLASILTGRGVELEFDGFDTLGIWTPPGKQAPFLCLEPWAGSAVRYPDEDGSFEGMHGVQRVEPAERKSYRLLVVQL